MEVKDVIKKFWDLSFPLKMAIFGVCWIIIAGALYYFLISSQFEEISRKKAELSKLKAQSSKIIKVKKKLAKFKREYAEVQEKFKVALKKLPDSKEIPKLLLKISSFGKSNNLDFLLFRPEQELRNDFFAVIPISIKFTGSFRETGNFFYEVGNMTRIVKIKKAVIKRRTGNLYVEAQLETYKFIGKKKNAKAKK